MNTAFNKQNFIFWCKVALYASRRDIIVVPSNLDSYMNRNRKKISSMYLEGYFVREVSFFNKNAFKYKPTQKFIDEFKLNYCEVSKKIRPDFSDEIRKKMLESFNF